MMRFTCLLHENTLFFMNKKCCSNWTLFSKKTALFALFQCDFYENLATSSERSNDALNLCITWKYVVFHGNKVLFKLNTFFEINGVICCISMRFWWKFSNIIGPREWFVYLCVLHENMLYFMSVVQIEHFFRKQLRYLMYINAILMKK